MVYCVVSYLRQEPSCAPRGWRHRAWAAPRERTGESEGNHKGGVTKGGLLKENTHHIYTHKHTHTHTS